MTEPVEHDGISFMTTLDELLLDLDVTRRERDEAKRDLATLEILLGKTKSELAVLKKQFTDFHESVPAVLIEEIFVAVHSKHPGTEGRKHVVGPPVIPAGWKGGRLVARAVWRDPARLLTHATLWGDHGNLLLIHEFDKPLLTETGMDIHVDLTSAMRPRWPELAERLTKMTGHPTWEGTPNA